MEAETIIQEMIKKRVDDGRALEDAYGHAIATLEADITEFDDQAKALRKRLEDAKEPEKYIEARLRPFGLQIDGIYLLLQTARLLQKDGWVPAA